MKYYSSANLTQGGHWGFVWTIERGKKCLAYKLAHWNTQIFLWKKKSNSQESCVTKKLLHSLEK